MKRDRLPRKSDMSDRRPLWPRTAPGTVPPVTTGATRFKLGERWPTAVGLLIGAAVCVAVILGADTDEDFTPGIATMMGIYLAAYAIGTPASAWGAFSGLGVTAAVVGEFGVDAGVAMTAVLGVLWLWVVARGLAGDTPWFTIETLGMVIFGGLTIAAVVADARLAGVLAGIGWLTHGVWDAYHFAADRVVVRSWSELCAVTDIPVGTVLIVVSLIR
jgi:hypothetical protein